MRLALALALMAGAAQAQERIAGATLAAPTERYDHGVLGDAVEWGALDIVMAGGGRVTLTLPQSRVFEDIEARLADLDGDGHPEVVVVETDLTRGASLAVYGARGRIAATPFLGQRHRWLAPAGIADFDGDGQVEVAYVDRPHLLAELVFVRLDGDRLVETMRLAGLTNHRIGDAFISGGVRDCGAGLELVLASKDWSQVMRVRRGEVAVIGPMPETGLADPPC